MSLLGFKQFIWEVTLGDIGEEGGGETEKGEKSMKCLLVSGLLLRQVEINPAIETGEHALELTN